MNTDEIKRRVFVVAYYFPPMGLSGVQRTLKLVKYLHDFGWASTILTITSKTYYAFDESFLTELAHRDVEIIRTNAIDPVKLFKNRKTIKLKNEWLRKILNRISQFFFIPDNKIFWKSSAVKAGLVELNKTEHQIIFSTAPPYTDHLVACELKRATGLPLVLDFRDSWLDNPYHFYWTPFHKTLHYHLERKVVKSANLIVTINRTIKEKLVARHRDVLSLGSVKVLTQGYDQEDFTKYAKPYKKTKGKMKWLYTGVFYEKNTPEPLYKALALLKISHPEIFAHIEFHMIGYVQQEFVNRTKIHQINDLFTYHDYQEHPVVIHWLSQADALWLSLGVGKGYESISTGKVYEYIGSGKPILALCPDNDVAKTLKPFPTARVINPGMIEEIRNSIVAMYTAWTKKGYPEKPDPLLQQLYERKFIASQLAKEFNMLARIAD